MVVLKKNSDLNWIAAENLEERVASVSCEGFDHTARRSDESDFGSQFLQIAWRLSLQ